MRSNVFDCTPFAEFRGFSSLNFNLIPHGTLCITYKHGIMMDTSLYVWNKYTHIHTYTHWMEFHIHRFGMDSCVLVCVFLYARALHFLTEETFWYIVSSQYRHTHEHTHGWTWDGKRPRAYFWFMDELYEIYFDFHGIGHKIPKMLTTVKLYEQMRWLPPSARCSDLQCSSYKTCALLSLLNIFNFLVTFSSIQRTFFECHFIKWNFMKKIWENPKYTTCISYEMFLLIVTFSALAHRL